MGWGIPIFPQKLNFYQYLSMLNFYVGYLLFQEFLRKVCKLQ